MDACGGFFLPDQGLFKVGLGGCLRLADDTVCTEQPVDGAKGADENDTRGAPMKGAVTAKAA